MAGDDDGRGEVVAANGIDIYVEHSGEGPRLLFLNGSTQTLDRMRPLLGLLESRFDLAAHDQRGLGRTSIPPGPYEMADYAADAAAVLDQAGWDTARVVGISFGGMVAQELAVTWPGRIERLALLCTSPGGAGGASYPLQELVDAPDAARTHACLPLLDTRFTPAWLAENDRDRAVAEQLAARRNDVANRPPEQVRGEREQLLARSMHDVTDRLGRITCPTLVAAGRYDGIAPPANSQAIASRIPGAELRMYEGGHTFVAQDRAALPEIMDFLAAG